jgi:hypothetical protein
MYASAPGEALLTLMRAHGLREPEDIKEILWAEHTVADVLWKHQYGFLDLERNEPAAVQELSKLAGHRAWWARLYAAEIMRQHAVFRNAALLERLMNDAHELVREAAVAANEAGRRGITK